MFNRANTEPQGPIQTLLPLRCLCLDCTRPITGGEGHLRAHVRHNHDGKNLKRCSECWKLGTYNTFKTHSKTCGKPTKLPAQIGWPCGYCQHLSNTIDECVEHILTHQGWTKPSIEWRIRNQLLGLLNSPWYLSVPDEVRIWVERGRIFQLPLEFAEKKIRYNRLVCTLTFPDLPITGESIAAVFREVMTA